MKRLKVLLIYQIVILMKENVGGVKAQHGVPIKSLNTATGAQKREATYFFMDANGSYKYTFDTGNGFEGAQTADQTNEVKGHYMYYDKGVPYMVKYRSGIQGYQPEVIPQSTGQAVPNPVMTQYFQFDDNARSHIVTAGNNGPSTTTVFPSAESTSNNFDNFRNTFTPGAIQYNLPAARTVSSFANLQNPFAATRTTQLDLQNRAGTSEQTAVTTNFRNLQNSFTPAAQFSTSGVQFSPPATQFSTSGVQFSPPAAQISTPAAAADTRTLAISANEGKLQPFKFVQDALSSMRTQPVQLSFGSQRGNLQLTNAFTSSSNSIADATLKSFTIPFSNNEVQQINNLPVLQQQQQQPIQQQQLEQLPKRPYAFSYLSDQSARTESGDKDGVIMGKYSYYDDAGFHDLSYKAGQNMGFVILGGNLAKQDISVNSLQATPTLINTQTTGTTATVGSTSIVGANVGATAVAAPAPSSPRQHYNYQVNVSRLPQGSYAYKVDALPQTGTATTPLLTQEVSSNIIRRSTEGRSLRKFRRYAKW